MKTHLKALVITVCTFFILVSLFYSFMGDKFNQTVETQKLVDAKVTVPDMVLTLLDGSPLNLKDFRGKVIIFNFWASWCSPCIEEVPSLISLAKVDSNIVVIAVSGDQNKDDIYAFLKSFPGLNKPPIYLVQENAKMLMEYFKVDKLPESFIFNPKGEMVKKISGTINWHTPESIEYFKVIRTQ